MTETRRLAELTVPWGRQEIQIEEVDFGTGGVPLLRLRISDQGEPIPAEDLGRIFDQLEAVRLKERGRSDLGLELAFCRMVVDAHGGQIFATNLVETGVVFTVELF